MAMRFRAWLIQFVLAHPLGARRVATLAGATAAIVIGLIATAVAGVGPFQHRTYAQAGLPAGGDTPAATPATRAAGIAAFATLTLPTPTPVPGLPVHPGTPEDNAARQSALAALQITPPTADALLELQVDGPADVLVADDTGRRAGADPGAQDAVFSEIPNAVYAGQGGTRHMLEVPQPAGAYTLQLVTDDAGGDTHLHIRLVAQSQIASQADWQGSIDPRHVVDLHVGRSGVALDSLAGIPLPGAARDLPPRRPQATPVPIVRFRAAPTATPTTPPPATPSPQPTAMPTPVLVLVPVVVGMDEGDAQALIKASGLATTFPNRQPQYPGSAGRVISQTPAGGQRVPPGTIVHIAVK